MSKIIKNISKENLAFAGFPMIEPNGTLEVSDEQAEILLKNSSVKMVEFDKKGKTLQAVEE